MPVSRSVAVALLERSVIASNNTTKNMTPEEADRFERLEKEKAALIEQLKAAENTIRRAKDISPEGRPCSNKRGFGR